MKNRYIRNIFVACVAMGAMAIVPGCVAEPWEDCPDTKIFIVTDHENGIYGDPGATRAQTRARYVDSWYWCIKSITVYVFDENERFVTLWEGGCYTIGEPYEIELRDMGLTPGLYTFVAWTNVGEHHSTNIPHDELMAGAGSIRLDTLSMSMAMTDPATRNITSDPAHRHFGSLTVYVSENSIIEDRRNVLVIDPAMHRVNFAVEGIKPSEIEQGYEIVVTDRNSEHNFRNQFVQGGEPYTQTRILEDVTGRPGGPGDWWPPEPPVEPEEPEEPGDEEEEEGEGDTRADGQFVLMAAPMRLMQMHDLAMTGLVVRNRTTGEVIWEEEDLVSLIRLVYNANNQKVDFEEVLEFDINLSFATAYRLVIEINGWTYIINAGEI